MQDILKRMLTELHDACFKPNGFKKTGGRFRRTVDVAMQEVLFQSSRWNSSNSPVTFYIYIWLGFTDITSEDSTPAFACMGQIRRLVPGAPAVFDLTAANYESMRSQLLVILPQAFLEWPKHYVHVRSLLKEGERVA